MSLGSALSIAAGGLANVTSQLAVVSQNVSNANTAGYTLEVGQQTALSANGMELGVRTGVTVRSVNTMLQAEAWQQNATVAAMTVRSQALAAIDAAHGTPGQGDDLASLTGALGDAFTTLSADPSSTAAQSAVVSAAGNLAGGINRVAQAVGTQRQAAQDSSQPGAHPAEHGARQHRHAEQPDRHHDERGHQHGGAGGSARCRHEHRGAADRGQLRATRRTAACR